MILPPRGVWCFMILNACWVQRKAPVRFVSSTDAHCSGAMSSSLDRRCADARIVEKDIEPPEPGRVSSKRLATDSAHGRRS